MDEISRYREIDLVRGIAILMMILFHTVFDLYFFRILPLEIYSGFWRYFAFSTASLFLLIVGISLTISRARTASTKSGYQLALKFVYRGAGIFLRASCHIVHLAVSERRFHCFWHSAPDRHIHNDLTALFQV